MDEGEDFITFISVPLLKDAVFMRIVIKLWELQCSLQTINFNGSLNPDDEDDDVDDMVYIRSFPGMEKKVLTKLSALGLPKQLLQEMVRYVRPIGEHLLNWLNPENFSFTNRSLHSLRHVHWTSEGTINVPETVRSVFDDGGDYQAMFMTVSNACLEDLIAVAWNRLPQYVKEAKNIYNEERCKKHRYDYHLVMYWICFFRDELPSLVGILKNADDSDVYDSDRSVVENMFDLSVYTRNDLAAKYFWPRLTEEEKNKNMMKWIQDLIEKDEEYYEREDGFFNLLFFLLGQMNHVEQQRQVFQKYGKELLDRILFDWPWQKYFLQMLSAMFPYLEESSYVDLMTKIVSNVRKGRMMEKLFREVWYASPSNLKACFLKVAMKLRKYRRCIFHDLFDHGDTDTIKMIINCAPEADKKKFLSRFVQSDDFFATLADSEENNVFNIDDFLRGTLSSESDISECKKLMWLASGNCDRLESDSSSEGDEHDSDSDDIYKYMAWDAMAQTGDFEGWDLYI